MTAASTTELDRMLADDPVDEYAADLAREVWNALQAPGVPGRWEVRVSEGIVFFTGYADPRERSWSASIETMTQRTSTHLVAIIDFVDSKPNARSDVFIDGAKAVAWLSETVGETA